MTADEMNAAIEADSLVMLEVERKVMRQDAIRERWRNFRDYTGWLLFFLVFLEACWLCGWFVMEMQFGIVRLFNLW